MVLKKNNNPLLKFFNNLFKLIIWPFKRILILGIIAGVLLTIFFNMGIKYSSSDKFCEICHVHPHATISWKQSTHFDNKTGIVVHCIECHLPPSGSLKYYTEKARLGAQDAYGKLFKDISKINWDAKSKLEHAAHYTYKESCIQCHQNLFPIGLTKKGEDAHLYYTQKPDELLCINCHLHVGHYSKEAEKEFILGGAVSDKEYYTKPAIVTAFENYTEFIPKSSVKFDMVAIPGGSFLIGSPESEPLHQKDEEPQVKVNISPFWMGKVEVSWDEYEVFFRQTTKEGRSDTQLNVVRTISSVDAITGPTPPYGNPAQGYGKGERPAITMSYYAAETYCVWLSQITEKKYRLPTEAEWEYACRGGKDTPYFFGGKPEKYTREGFWNKIFGPDTSVIASYIVYNENANGMTQLPTFVKPNPFGLYNMSGNVKEFCMDWFAPDIYTNYKSSGEITDPRGPETGTEHVVRGGSYKTDAALARSAARDHTNHSRWMVTDPQVPKSLWWYSDCTDVGFRVVCEYEK